MWPVLSTLVLLCWLALTADALRHAGSIRRLADIEPLAAAASPAVSIVVAARNEQEAVQRGANSLLALDYPRFEVVAVDDRSTDRTGAMLDALAGGNHSLRVLHVDRLPPGWLGKNHALSAGAGAARGEWLLFTDADVVFEPTALARAMAYARHHRLDHLSVAPALAGRGFWMGAFLAFFTLGFGLLVRPWRIREPGSPAYAGIGAFNLIRAGAYRSLGGHRAIRLRPDDDMMLGRCVKRAGLRQDLLLGADLVSVAWYPSIGEAVRGLEKNMFAGLGYNLGHTLGAVALLLGLGLLPFVGVAAAGGWPRWVFAAAAAVALLDLRQAGRTATVFRDGQALVLPAMALLWSYILLRSAVLALVRGGIRWRDTFYPLDELRRNRG